MERTYYTLDDIRKALEITGEGPYAIGNRSLSSFLNSCLSKVNFNVAPAFTEREESLKCFQSYIWPRFYQEAIIYVDSDESEDFVEKFCRTKVGQIMSWWMSSAEKYIMLIKNLNSNKAKLLDVVKSSSVA